MPFTPVKVDPSGKIRMCESFSAKRSRCGPYSKNGNLYGFFTNRTAGKIQCWRSTDQGATWGQIDGANAKSFKVSALFGYANYSTTIDVSAGVVHIVYVNPSTNWEIATFNLNTETWGSAYSGVAYTIFGATNPQALALRGDGRRVLFYRFGAYITISAGGLWDAAWTPLVPDADISVAGVTGMIEGPTGAGIGLGRVYFIFNTMYPASGGARQSAYKVMDVSGTVSSFKTIFVFTANVTREGGIPAGIVSFLVPINECDAGSVPNPAAFRVARAAFVGVGDPVFTISSFPVGVNVTYQMPMACAHDDPVGVENLFFARDDEQKIYRSQRLGGTWQAPVEIIATGLPPDTYPSPAGRINSLSANAVGGGIGLFADWGDPNVFVGPVQDMHPYYWQDAAGVAVGNMNSLLGVMRSPKLV